MLRLEEVSKLYRKHDEGNHCPANDQSGDSRQVISWPLSAPAAVARPRCCAFWGDGGPDDRQNVDRRRIGL